MIKYILSYFDSREPGGSEKLRIEGKPTHGTNLFHISLLLFSVVSSLPWSV